MCYIVGSKAETEYNTELCEQSAPAGVKKKKEEKFIMGHIMSLSTKCNLVTCVQKICNC